MKRIDVQQNKTLRLDNVLIKNIFQVSTLSEDENDLIYNDISLETEIAKMNNVIRMNGAIPIGPLIQYSGAKQICDGDTHIKLCLMIQSDRYLNNLKNPYEMQSSLVVKNCMYVRFTGFEDDISYAYEKIRIEAYEWGVKLKGNSYTIYLGSDKDTGMITADIFMEVE